MRDIEISEENKEPENTCEACGEDHEITECDFGFCGHCYEVLDNCDCEGPERIIEEECPECNGDREIDEDEDDEDEGAERVAS